MVAMRIGGGRSSPENTVCSCKQMAGNYLQFAIYTSVLPFSPSIRRLSFLWLFLALSFHPEAIHRLPGNCQRSAPRNAGVAGQQRTRRRHVSALIYVFPPRGTTEGCVGISLPGKARNISADISRHYTRPLLTSWTKEKSWNFEEMSSPSYFMFERYGRVKENKRKFFYNVRWNFVANIRNAAWRW